MAYSMTGFGEATAETDTARVTVQVRSVNHRFADIRLRLPPSLIPQERAVRGWIAAGVQRGRIEVNVNLEPVAGKAESYLNRALLDEVIQTVRILHDDYGIPGELDISRVISLSGIFRPDSAEIPWGDNEQVALESAVREAVAQLREDRAREGENLRKDLAVRAESMLESAARLRQLADQIPSRLKERLLERLESLRGEVELDPTRVVQEAIFFAERADVTEEMVRLAGHLERLRELLNRSDDKPLGKRLEFLVQEIHRETNTVNSKSADLEISEIALELKQETEKVREQIANLE